MFCRALIPLCFGLAVAHLCNQQGSESPNNITSGSLPLSLVQLKSFRQRSEVGLVSAEDLADMHAARSEQMRIAWEGSNHALKAVNQKMGEIGLAQYPGDTNGSNSSATLRYHANATARYNQQLGNAVNETMCRACADAEESLINALTKAREGHIAAQKLAVALSETQKAHEEAVINFTDYRGQFVRKKTKLEQMKLTLKSPKTDFNTFVNDAQRLYPLVQLANQAELAKTFQETSMQSAQTAYDHAAGAALQLDATVTEKRRVKEKSCIALGLPTKPPTTTTTTPVLPPGFTGKCSHQSGWTYILDYSDERGKDDIPDTPKDIANGFANKNAFFMGNANLEQLNLMNTMNLEVCFASSSANCIESCEPINANSWVANSACSFPSLTDNRKKAIAALSGQCVASGVVPFMKKGKSRRFPDPYAQVRWEGADFPDRDDIVVAVKGWCGGDGYGVHVLGRGIALCTQDLPTFRAPAGTELAFMKGAGYSLDVDTLRIRYQLK